MQKKSGEIALMEWLNTHYGIIATSLVHLPLGADRNASVYKAQTSGGKSYFVKLKRGYHSNISVTLLDFLQASGIQQIISPIKTVDGKLMQHTSHCTIIVYPFIQGQDGFCCPLTEDQWIVLGQTLKQVHELDLPPSLKDQIRKETYTSCWSEVLPFLDGMEKNVAEDAAALKLLAFMKKHQSVLHRLVSQTQQLHQSLQKKPAEFVLCHSDIHAGNVLIDESCAIYIVDWDEPILAPKERDLMFMGAGVANVWNQPREEALFYQGYGNTNIDKPLLAYYRHERILQDIIEYCHALLLTSDGGKERCEMYKQFVDMFEPSGVIDITFKTKA
jgi:spectinomycin phosphotransferase